jgi:ATP-binding cassette subfamily B protein
VSDKELDEKAIRRRSWQTFLSLLRPSWFRVAIGTVLGIIATVAGLWTPLIVERVIVHLTNGTSVVADITLFAILTGTYLVASVSQWGILGIIGEDVVYAARKKLVARLFWGRLSEVRARPAADLVSRASADAPMLATAVGTGFVTFVTATTGVVGSIVLMGVIDSLMLGITVAAVLVLGVSMGLIMPIAGRRRALAQEAVGELSTELSSSISALGTVKSLRGEEIRSQAVLQNASAARKHGVVAMWAEVAGYEVGFGGMQIVTVVMLAIGAMRVMDGQLTIAALVAFIMYTQNFTGPLMEIADGFSSIESGLAASSRLAEVDEIEMEDVSDTTTEASSSIASSRNCPNVMHPSVPLIEFKDVSVKYPGDSWLAVRNLSVSFPRTGHVVIAGQAGAGKTTILGMLLGFINPTSGTIKIDGVPYDDVPLSELRKRIAYVEQDPVLLPGTIRDNLIAGNADVPESEIEKAVKLVHLDDEVDYLEDGLETVITPTTFTTSQKQSLALARGLLTDAEILVLDEATSLIGGATEANLHEYIDEKAKRSLVVSVAHRVTTVVDADLIIVMDDGGVAGIGTHKELLASNKEYQQLVGV